MVLGIRRKKKETDMKRPTEKTVEEFIKHMEESGYSGQTRKSYRISLNRICKDLGTGWWLRTRDDLNIYLERRYMLGLSKYSLVSKISMMRSLCDWMRAKGRITNDPMEGIRVGKIVEKKS